MSEKHPGLVLSMSRLRKSAAVFFQAAAICFTLIFNTKNPSSYYHSGNDHVLQPFELVNPVLIAQTPENIAPAFFWAFHCVKPAIGIPDFIPGSPEKCIYESVEVSRFLLNIYYKILRINAP